MMLLDAYAVIAYLMDEPVVSDLVEPLIPLGAITTVNSAEVIDQLVRVRQGDPGEAVLDLGQLDLTVIVVDEIIATRAALLRAKHYHRTTRTVSLADCIAAAAVLVGAEGIDRLATSDPALLDLLHEEGGGVHPLPSRDGTVWAPRPG